MLGPKLRKQFEGSAWKVPNRLYQLAGLVTKSKAKIRLEKYRCSKGLK